MGHVANFSGFQSKKNLRKIWDTSRQKNMLLINYMYNGECICFSYDRYSDTFFYETSFFSFGKKYQDLYCTSNISWKRDIIYIYKHSLSIHYVMIKRRNVSLFSLFSSILWSTSYITQHPLSRHRH